MPPFGTRLRTAMAAAVLVGALGACTRSVETPPVPVPPAPVTGLRGSDLFVNPNNAAQDQLLAWEKAGRTGDADLIRRIADRPIATWLSQDTGSVEAQVRDVVDRAAVAGTIPVVVAYNIPHRDCGGYSSGGTGSDDHYRDWVAAIARGLGDRPVVVILEPDAVAHTLDGCMTEGVESRLNLLRAAITTLKASGSALVYLDAGNPRWIARVDTLAEQLRRAGIDGADGFALNVSNFVVTGDNIEYGSRLSAALGGATFVIDTSRNGNGPHEGATVGGAPTWCNPPGRALGDPPTTVHTGSDLVDALLWIKVPGESDGACRAGEPAAGRWWPEYALDLARTATP